MENNVNINLSMLSGLNAYSFTDSGDCFHVNKSLGNGKQYISDEITSSTIVVNNSLLNTLNVIDSNIKSDLFDTSLKTEATYTLDDLLDLGNEDLNPTTYFDASLNKEDSFLSQCDVTDQISLETAMASPLSSSSEESCDLDEILFMNQPEVSEANNTPMETGLLEELNAENGLETIDHSSLQDMLNASGGDLGALCSLLLQSQDASNSEPEKVNQIENETFVQPSSPSGSETSECESVRYKPYKKQRTPEQKQRKKAQNRTAATRYRIKKKDELKAMSAEADELEQKNKELKGKVDGLKSEIDYLKNLMLDVIKARLAKGAKPENLLSVVLAQ